MSSAQIAPVLAAGAVCWRRKSGRLEVLVISRPSHQDVSLPKGKVDEGESLPEAAVREVREETGFQVTLGVPLGTTDYVLPNGRDKVVQYWAAEVPATELARGRFTPNDEVDRMEWVSLTRARRMLSYERDGDVLQRFAAMAAARTVESFALIALRHAKAEFDSESGADADRLLTPVGLEQARAIVPVIQAFGPAAVVSSPAARCLATVGPLAKTMKLPVKERVAIGQDGWESEGHNPSRLRHLVERRIERGQTAVLCSHAPVLPELLEQIAEATGSANGARVSRAGILATAEFSVVHLARAAPHTIVGIETHSSGR